MIWQYSGRVQGRFGQSKMVSGGKPLVFMHEAPKSFKAFAQTALGSTSGWLSCPLGYFFTLDPVVW